jgi:sporulation-control protein
MFKRMLSAFGVGGPSIDTVLDTPHATPGEVISGQVHIQGGSADAHIEQIALSLVTRVEVEHSDHEYGGTAEFLRVAAASNVRAAAGQPMSVPFQLPIPWETPITAVRGTALPGMTVGVRTELVIAGSPDKGDLDPIAISPLPAQNRVLDAFGELGFQFRSVDVEAGHIHGVRQELGFYQEIEFFPPAQFAGRINQVELTFVANPDELYVILEADKRGDSFSAGGDSFGHFHLSHHDALSTDWASAIGQWLAQVAERVHATHGRTNPAFGGHHGHNPVFGGHHEYGHHGHKHGYDHHEHHRPGMGGVVAGAAAGVAGGMVLGEVFDEVFEDDGADEDL